MQQGLGEGLTGRFELIRVLHWSFSEIHGNGRCGRFSMNATMAADDHPRTVVPIELRDEYIDALEEASVGQNILPLTGRFLKRML
ncbi:MAG: hypothetical protein ACFCUJ_07890 [Thiotrichales bacterium]